jgi:hypothetical protein
MISDIEPHLAALSVKYHENHGKLPKAETEEARKLCGEALVEHPEGVELCFRFATTLPPEAVASAFAENWSTFDEARRRQLTERLQRLPLPGARRLGLTLSVAIQRAEPLSARRILTQTCHALLGGKNQQPSQKNIRMFRNVLLDGGEPALLGFQFSGALRAEVAPLLACIVTAVFTAPEDKALTSSSTGPRVLEWLWRQDLFGFLDVEQQEGVLTATASWSRKTKAEFTEKFSPLPSSFQFLLEQQPDETGPPPLRSDSQQPSPDDDESHRNSTPGLIGAEPSPAKREVSQKLPARELLAQLGDAFKELENAHMNALREHSDVQRANQELRTKLCSVDADLRRAEFELREARKQLDQASAERSAAQREVTNLHDEVELLNMELAEARRQHDQEADALTARMKVETERGIEAFKNSLADKIRLEWRDFEDVSGLPMTLEIGDSHRRQLHEIFALLERDGIQFKG